MQKLSLTELNILIGKNIKTYRCLRGVSQTELGKAVGVSFQQIQKYERARNRISSDRLYSVSQYLNMPLGKFFEDSEIIKTLD